MVIGNTQGYFPSKDYANNLFDIQRGIVPGYRFFQRNMYTPQASTTYYSTLWTVNSPSLYPYLAAAQPLMVSSTSTDDKPGSPGAQTVSIEGLDADYRVVIETVILSGQTGVSTVNSFLRVNVVTATTFGVLERNAGNISVGSGIVSPQGTNTVTHGYVRSDKIFSEVGVLTVPAEYTLLGFGSQVSVAAGKEAIVRVRTRPNPVTPWDFTAATALLHTQNQNFSPQLIVATEKSDVEIQAIADVANTQISAQFQLALVDNRYL